MIKLLFIFITLLSFLFNEPQTTQITPAGAYILIYDAYSTKPPTDIDKTMRTIFETALYFKRNNEVVFVEKNYKEGYGFDDADLLEKYTRYWDIKDNKLCFYHPLDKKTSECLEYLSTTDKLIIYHGPEKLEFIRLHKGM